MLPQWLAQPDVILRDIRRNLVAVGAVQGLSPATLKKLQDNGVTSFFPGNTSNTSNTSSTRGQPVTPVTPVAPEDNQ